MKTHEICHTEKENLQKIEKCTNSKQDNDYYLQALKTQCYKGIEAIYEDHFSCIRNMIVKRHGSTFDARDIFQEALIIIYKKVQTNSLDLTCSFRRYLCIICRNLWIKTVTRKRFLTMVDEFTLVADDFEEDEQNQMIRERRKLLQEKMKLLNHDEEKILQLFFSGMKMREIAQIMGYGSEGYAKKKKYYCKKKLVALIKNDVLFAELSF